MNTTTRTPGQVLYAQLLDVNGSDLEYRWGKLSGKEQREYEDYAAAVLANSAHGEAVAEVGWYDPALDPLPRREGHKIIDASLAFFDHAPLGTKLYLHPAYPAPSNPWRDAVLDAMTLVHVEWDDANPRESLRALIETEVAIALDPLVSSDARALIERGRTEAAPAVGPGTPAWRFSMVMDELEKRFPDPEPFSSSLPEVRYLKLLDAALAAPAVGAEPVAPWVAGPRQERADALRVALADIADSTSLTANAAQFSRALQRMAREALHADAMAERPAPQVAADERALVNWCRDGIADFIADNWPMRKHALEEIEAGIRAIEINPERRRAASPAPAPAAPAWQPNSPNLWRLGVAPEPAGLKFDDEAEPAQPAGEAELPPRIDRTPTDYALEHAEYMAASAEQLLAALNSNDECWTAVKDDDHEVDQATIDALNAAGEAVTESRRHLLTKVYEFRKRRDRAARTVPTAVPRESLTAAVIDAARRAMDDSKDRGDTISLSSHDAAALSLALDEYDRANGIPSAAYGSAHGIAARGTSTDTGAKAK